MSNELFLNRLASEIQPESMHRSNNSYSEYNRPKFQNSKGRLVSLREFATAGMDEPIIGGLLVSSVAGKFIAVDRLYTTAKGVKQSRRLLFYLDTKSGQIGAALILELLKLEDMSEFSKHKFIRRVEKEYFSSQGIVLPTSDLTEVLSRMMRKTLNDFFGEHGKYFRRFNFALNMVEIDPEPHRTEYLEYKSRIDQHSKSLKSFLKTQPVTN